MAKDDQLDEPDWVVQLFGASPFAKDDPLFKEWLEFAGLLTEAESADASNPAPRANATPSVLK
ncbi:MAG: hypothetical protein WBD07_03065 [Vicinamibacterales bacterium]